jgi:fatty-acid peroxygenase
MGGNMTALRDRTLSLARLGYQFSDWIARHSPASATAIPLRLLGRRSLLLRGADGVALFYDEQRVRRIGALPGPVAHTLYGKGAVHALDDEEHRDRKRLFLEVTRPELVADLAERAARAWDVETERWLRSRQGTVFPSAVRALGTAVQEWAGVGGTPVVMRKRARDLIQIVDGVGSPGPSWVRARLARRRADRWAMRLIEEIRSGRRRPPPTSAAHVMAWAVDASGELLPTRTAAVELLNVLRPTVAVSYFVVFAAIELEANPDLNDECATGDPAALRMFAEEVRRTSPCVPLIGGRSRCPFAWQGHRVREGDRLVLDVYGTNRDPSAWADGDTFDPGRFRAHGELARPDFVPQGGGRVDTGHRCPGEGISVSLLELMILRMARLDWRIHPDDHPVSLQRMPARPATGLRLFDVRRNYQPELLG